MTLAITKETFVRYERYGGFVYVLNKQNQNKMKIADREEALLFWQAISGKKCCHNSKIKEWLENGFLEEKSILSDTRFSVADKNSFDKEIFNKPKDYASLPLLATLGITSKCNFKCGHCGNDSGKEGRRELSRQEIFRLIEEMSEMRVLKLNLTGGEPLLCQDFFKILGFAASKIPRVTVTSNAWLINKKTSRQLKKSGVAAVKISIDGLKDFHDRNRGVRGAYEKAINAIKFLKEDGIEVRVQSALMKMNANEILNLMPVLAGLEIKAHSIVPVSPIGRADRELMLSSLDYQRYILRVAKYASSLGSKTNFEIRPVFGLKFKNNLEILSTKYKCEALKTTLEITPAGKAIPCSFFPVQVGDIRKSSLKNIWLSKKAHQIRRAFNESLLIGRCRKCKFKGNCGGGCLANSYALHKRFHLGDIYCWR